MNKLKLLVLILSLSVKCFGQAVFEKGYFVNNEGLKIECLIKNNDWGKNPRDFMYKLSNDGEIKNADIKDVKEFRVTDYSKYVRADVDIDMSPVKLTELSNSKDPEWERKLVFLKVLVEGNASLYYYNVGGSDQFFYQCKDSAVHQLVYKEYKSEHLQMEINAGFHKQLLRDMPVQQESSDVVLSLNYIKGDLVRYFQHYNLSVDPTYKVIKVKHVRDMLNFRVSTGFDYSSLSISNPGADYMNASFNGKLNYRFAFEMEYILPFNRNQWGVVLESSYHSYKAQMLNTETSATVDCKSIDFSFGVKRYIFLNENAKLFVDGYINSIGTIMFNNSKIGYKYVYSLGPVDYLDIMNGNNLGFGAGYEYKKFFAELRYYTAQDILSNYGSWHSKFQRFSLIVGYKIFKIRNK